MKYTQILNWCYGVTWASLAIISALKIEDIYWKILFVMISLLGLHIFNNCSWDEEKSSPI